MKELKRFLNVQILWALFSYHNPIKLQISNIKVNIKASITCKFRTTFQYDLWLKEELKLDKYLESNKNSNASQ